MLNCGIVAAFALHPETHQAAVDGPDLLHCDPDSESEAFDCRDFVGMDGLIVSR
jgi:hypothetical protein